MVDGNLIPNHARFKDLSGLTFKRWTVVRFDGMRDNRAWWWCRCECGTERSVLGKTLVKGISRSCGCLQRETVTAMNTKHMMSRSPEFVVWCHMLKRCSDTDSLQWKDYGGRGIAVCKRWKEFANFIADIGQRPTPKHTIERRDNNLGYSPENCVWATRTQQARNKRTTVMLTSGGKTQCLAEWCEELGMNYHTLYTRIFNRGWSVEAALNTPKTHRWKHRQK